MFTTARHRKPCRRVQFARLVSAMLGLLLILPIAKAAEHAHGIHGMVLFSDGQRLFASHMPLYQHPHDYQVALQLSSPENPALIARLAETPLLTIAPEAFDLRRLEPAHPTALQQFQAAVYLGHFERGGERWFAARFTVEKTWLFAPLQLDGVERFYRVGEPPVFFVIVKIHQRPDQDRIYRIEWPSAPSLPAYWTPPLPFPLPKPIYLESEDLR